MLKKIIRFVLVVGMIGLFTWTLIYLYQKSEETPMVSTTSQAEKATIIKKTVANGSVVPRKEIAIKPQVSGILDEVYIVAGELVTKGQLLAKVQVIPDMANLNNAENRLKQAKIALNNAQQDFDRQKKLFDDEVISSADFQRFQLTYDQAVQEKQASKDNLQIVREGAIQKSGGIQNTLIRSTVKGMILEVPVEEGYSVIEANTFNEGTTVCMIADMSDMIFEGKVDESEVGKIKVGMPLLLSVGAIENQQFDAILKYIAPKGVEENGAIQFDIKAEVKLQDSLFIRAGYSANADIILDRADSVMSVDEALLKFDDEGTYVEVEVGKESFEKRYLETGLSDGIRIEVLSGINWEDKIKSGEVPANEAATK